MATKTDIERARQASTAHQVSPGDRLAIQKTCDQAERAVALREAIDQAVSGSDTQAFNILRHAQEADNGA